MTAVISLIGVLSLLLGVPLFLGFLILGGLGYANEVGLDAFFAWLRGGLYWKFANYDLAIIPMFLLFGELTVMSGVARALFQLFEGLVQRRGGALFGVIATSASLGLLVGSSLATTTAVSRIARPTMKSMGYPLHVINAVIAASGTLGVLIPPSLVLVVYAWVAQVSLIDLFAAAMIPAVFAVLGNLLVTSLLVRYQPQLLPAQPSTLRLPRASLTTLQVFQALCFVVMIAVVLAGMFIGWFTPNQAASIAVSLALVVCIAARSFQPYRLLKLAVGVAKMTVSIYLILFASEIFSAWIVLTGLIDDLSAFVTQLQLDATWIIVVMLAVILVGGCFMDSLALMAMIVPVAISLISRLDAVNLALSPYQMKIWLGMLMLIVVEIGLITPPFGLNVLSLHQGADRTNIAKTFYWLTPYVLVELVRVGVMLAFPALSLLWLNR